MAAASLTFRPYGDGSEERRIIMMGSLEFPIDCVLLSEEGRCGGALQGRERSETEIPLAASGDAARPAALELLRTERISPSRQD
jgi:hypothetical protein